jgi:hypothetical protein
VTAEQPKPAPFNAMTVTVPLVIGVCLLAGAVRWYVDVEARLVKVMILSASYGVGAAAVLAMALSSLRREWRKP